MKRIDLQRALADTIERARAEVKRRSGFRKKAIAVGAYRFRNLVFACIDGETAFQIRGNRIIEMESDDFGQYILPKYSMVVTCEFNRVSVDTLKTLLTMFRKVAAPIALGD